MWREAWLSLVVVGMREVAYSLGAHSPKGGTVHVCFLQCLVTVVEVRCLQWKNRKEVCYLSVFSFDLVYSQCVKYWCLITTFVKMCPELDLLQFLKLISAGE